MAGAWVRAHSIGRMVPSRAMCEAATSAPAYKTAISFDEAKWKAAKTRKQLLGNVITNTVLGLAVCCRGCSMDYSQLTGQQMRAVHFAHPRSLYGKDHSRPQGRAAQGDIPGQHHPRRDLRQSWTRGMLRGVEQVRGTVRSVPWRRGDEGQLGLGKGLKELPVVEAALDYVLQTVPTRLRLHARGAFEALANELRLQ